MRADARANRAALIAAARQLYAQRGPDVPHGAVAAEAGVGVGTLYRHFPTQQDLVIGVVEQFGEEVEAVCSRWSEPMATEPDQAWPLFVADFVQLQVAAFMPRVVEGDGLDVQQPRVVQVRQQALTHIGEILELAKSAGLVDRSVATERFLIGLAIATRPVPSPAAPLVGDVNGWLVGVYLRGLRPGD